MKLIFFLVILPLVSSGFIKEYYCGSGFLSTLASFLASAGCNRETLNECCKAHDDCYVSINVTRKGCDSVFCNCAREAEETSFCKWWIGVTHCEILKLFGVMDEKVESKSILYFVEKILEKRYTGRKKNRIEYLIKWRDYDETENTWEPKACLQCDGLLEEFERKWKAKRKEFIRKRSGNRRRNFDVSTRKPKLFTESEAPRNRIPPTLFPDPIVDEKPHKRVFSISRRSKKMEINKIPEIPLNMPLEVHEIPVFVNLAPVSETPELTVKAVSIKGLYFLKNELTACIETDQGKTAFVNPKALGKQNLDLIMDFILNSIYVKLH